LYPVSIVAAFVIGEGILSALTGDSTADPVFWHVVVAGTPALFALVAPGILAVIQGRRAIELGRSDGRVPAIVGAAIGGGLIVLNLVPYLVGLVVD
jgi:hypothetical protein